MKGFFMVICIYDPYLALINPGKSGILHLLRLIWKTGYTLVVNVQRFATSGILAAFSRAEAIVGFNKNPLSLLFTSRVAHVLDGRRETDRNQALIAKYTDSITSRLALYPSTKDQQKILPYIGRPFITISPGSF